MPELLPHPLFLQAKVKERVFRNKNIDEYNSYEDLKKIILELNLEESCVQ